MSVRFSIRLASFLAMWLGLQFSLALASEPRPVRWIFLTNGDRFTGDFAADSLRLNTIKGELSVSTASLHSLTNSSVEPGMVMLSLFDGSTLEGRLCADQLTFRLSVGGEIVLSRTNLAKVIIARENASAATTIANSSPPRQGVAGPGGTNLANLVWIAPGQFTMGSPTDEAGRDPDESPQTRVTIGTGFWIAKFEVTQAEYQKVMGSNPSTTLDDPARPVEKVTWHEALEYCRKLTELEEAQARLPKGYAYRLPTEAEWEYACRAGTATRFSYGEDRNETQLGEYGWFIHNSDATTHRVGEKRPNPWGLHDMHGNVWEWCLDRWEGKYPGGTITNALKYGEGNLRVARGGSWLYEAKACRSANRDDYNPGNRCSDLGFRVVLAPVAP